MEAAAATGVPTSDSPAELIVPTGHHDCMGRFDESGNVLTLAPIADVSVSQKGGDKNVGDSNRLYVANDGGREWQSLLLFVLALVAKSFGTVVGVAALSVYSAWDSDSGALAFRKMARCNRAECGVAGDDVAGNDGTRDNKLMISFVEYCESDAWCRVDVTAAVRNALENREPRLGIRSTSPPQVLVHPGPGPGRFPGL